MQHISTSVVAAASMIALVAASGLAPRDLAASPIVTGDEVSGPTVVAVGDIACEPGGTVAPRTCQQAATALLAQGYNAKYVLGLGDLQYLSGSLSEFLASYDKSWGALKSITRPIPGNHEYRTPAASGYFTYFENQQPGGAGYYAFDIGNWRIYALNSNCEQIDCAKQLRWLNSNMAAHPRRCSAIMLHHPRFASSGANSGTAAVQPFWEAAYQHRTDIALAGHAHIYERFRRMTPSGRPSRTGILSFVSGAGGKSLHRHAQAHASSR